MSYLDTIYALSSGRLPAGIAVIRISGSLAASVCKSLAGCVPSPRQATYVTIRGDDREIIDRGLALYLPGPATFTGEDIVELQLHGSRAVVAAVFDFLGGRKGLRPADAGEFSRRAFLSGKMDLLQAEALADLIEAETESQRRLAIANADGAQTRLYEAWRERLLHALAMIEAELDFPDEDDVPGSASEAVWLDVAGLATEMRAHMAGYKRAEMIRQGFDVVIAGPPNAGKSSLLNALLKRDAALVSEEPGTTRDLVEAVMDIDGYKVRITDTAGLREDAGRVEAMGIDKARRRIANSDLVLFAIDLSAGPKTGVVVADKIVMVGTKSDRPIYAHHAEVKTSAETGEGIDDLIALIGRYAAEAISQAGDVLPSRARHVEEIEHAAEHLLRAAAETDRGLELRAENLRAAARRLAKVVGAIDPDAVLGSIFSRFCIGK